MSDNQSHEAKRFQLLSSVGQIGWWEADFATGECTKLSLPAFNFIVPTCFIIFWLKMWKIIP